MLRTRTSLLLAVAVIGSMVFASPATPPAAADGNPDISLSVEMDAGTLHTDTTEVTLTASNATGTDGFNLSYRIVLPPGVSYASGPVPPIVGADPSILFFENVSDLLGNNDASFTFMIDHGTSVPVGSTVTIDAEAHVSLDARLIPDFDPVTGTVTGDSDGYASSSGSTEVVAFRVSKTEASPESELVRGLHNETTIYTITIENNPNAATNDFMIHDWIPAGLEFLSCGGGDNSTTVVPPAVIPEEYPGSGPISTPPPPDCVLPTLVETVDSGLPTGLPAGVYTHVVWDSTGAFGDVDLASGATYVMNYAAAIPLRMNTMAWGGPAGTPPVDGAQASNVDNNSGGSTEETTSELAFTNRAYASGRYSFDGTSYTHRGQATVTSEDVALQKSVTPDSIVPGQTSTWTLDIQVSEYTTSASSIQVVDTVPDGLRPTGSVPAWTSADENADGTWTVVWDLADMGSDQTAIIEYTTVTLSHYRENQADAAPVLAADSWENQVSLTAVVDTRRVLDASEAGQTAGIVTILKEVAVPGDTVAACDDGSGITAWAPDTAGPYGPGDRVCWRLTVIGNHLYGNDYAVQDYLPDGFAYESWAYGSNNTATTANITFDGSSAASGYLRWSLDDHVTNTDPDGVFEAIVSTIITGPTGNGSGDLLSNLMKFGGSNTPGEAYQLRDDAEAVWGAPVIGIDKQATHEVVQGGDAVDFTITVANTGNTEALDVEVWDVLPPGLGCATIPPASINEGGVCDGTENRIEWTISSIAAGGGSVDLSYTSNVPTSVGAGEEFTNETGVRRFETSVNTGSDHRFEYIPSDNIDPTQNPSANTDPVRDDWMLNTEALAIAKTRSTQVEEPGNALSNRATIGEQVDYTVTVTIPEGVTVYNGVLVDDYNENRVAYVPASAAATLNGSSLPSVWVLSDTGGQVSVTYATPYVNPPDSGDDTLVLDFSVIVRDVDENNRSDWLPNRARQSWLDSSPTPDNDHSIQSNNERVRIVEPNLVVDKDNNDGDGTVQAGQTVEYSIEVTNSSDGVSEVSRAHDLLVVDTLPASLDCGDISNISNSGTCSDTNPDTIMWSSLTEASLLTLDPGASNAVTFTYDATFPDPIVTNAPFTNTAWVGGSSMVGTPGEERAFSSPFGGPGTGYQDTDQDTLTAPETEIAKSVTPGTQTIGEPVQYTVTVMYPRDTILYDATIIDMLPIGITVAPPYTAFTLCELGSAGSGVFCDSVAGIDLIPMELTPSGGDIGWWLGDLTNTSSQDRFVTIVYDAFVEDLSGPAPIDGNVLTNSVNTYTNQTNKLAPIDTVPDSPNYDVTGVRATADVLVREPNLVLEKHVIDDGAPVASRRALPNEDLTYEVTLRNTGTWPAYDAEVTDAIVIPSGNAVSAVRIVHGTSNGVAYTVTDADPTDGSLAWFINGPIPAGGSVTIEYTVRVWDATEADESVAGPEISNEAANPSYWAVPTHTTDDGHREYAGNTDSAEVELDLASIGDYVWFDANGDGVQDADELPIAGATVTVTYNGPGGPETHVTTTNSTGPYVGAYLVEDLPGGTYTVTVTDVPVGMTPTYDLDGTPDGTWNGSLGEAEAKRDVDFGFAGTGSIGDLVWMDLNGDGVQDADEPRIESAEVTVVFAGLDGDFATTDDNVTYVTTTDAAGFYLVDRLLPGEYTMTVTNMPISDVGPTFDRDSATGGTADGTTSLTLANGEDIRDADFGYSGDGTIGDTVWFDRDRDGVQDPDEPGIADVVVGLVWPGPDGRAGTPDDVTFHDTTDEFGVYGFVGLNEGVYSVTVDVLSLPPGMDATFDEDLNGDPSATPDGHTEVTLSSGEVHSSADFGYGGSGSLGDFVWWDLNGDGVQDGGEPGIPGVVVEVVWSGADGDLGTPDDVTYEATTDAAGGYLVEDLPDGPYRVTVVGSLPGSATNTSDYDGNNDSTADLALAGGVANLDVDFGYVGDNSIGDFVWYDANGDGVQDGGEPPISGVDVTLTWAGVDGDFDTDDDVVLPPVETDASGAYGFSALPDGDYRVAVTGGLPVGVAPTFDEDSGTTSPDEVTVVAGLSGGTFHDTADFGYNGDGTIGDTIFWDLDGNGVQDDGEPGFPNVDVTVTWAGADGALGTADDYVTTTTTDSDGMYLVENLAGGLHQVEVDTTDLPADVVQTADPDAAFDSTSQVILPASGSDLDQDFGYRGASSIGDTVWFDVDGDATQGPGEPGLEGVTVVVTWLGPDQTPGGSDDVVITTITDADGHYLAPGLVEGSYAVEMIESTLPSGGVANSDVDGGDPAASDVTLGVSEVREDVDYGIVGSASLSGTVWHDRNADGIIDAGEAGIPNAVVHVTWHGPNGPVVFDVTTDASGAWSIENLPAGDYTADVDMATVPADFVATTPESVDVTLPPFGIETVDHGVVGSATIGSIVWVDTNGNGVVDGGESGIEGVLVDLIDADGTVIATEATTSTGAYEFTDLVPGTYTVRLVDGTIPSDLRQTYSKTGVLDLSATETVGEGQSTLDVNFGFQEQTLPVTGADLARLLLIALLLIAGGIVLRLTARTRRDHQN